MRVCIAGFFYTQALEDFFSLNALFFYSICNYSKFTCTEYSSSSLHSSFITSKNWNIYFVHVQAVSMIRQLWLAFCMLRIVGFDKGTIYLRILCDSCILFSCGLSFHGLSSWFSPLRVMWNNSTRKPLEISTQYFVDIFPSA